MDASGSSRNGDSIPSPEIPTAMVDTPSPVIRLESDLISPPPKVKVVRVGWLARMVIRLVIWVFGDSGVESQVIRHLRKSQDRYHSAYEQKLAAMTKDRNTWKVRAENAEMDAEHSAKTVAKILAKQRAETLAYHVQAQALLTSPGGHPG
jgi:hypothetical protein